MITTGAAKAGVIYVPASSKATNYMVQKLIEHCDPVFIVLMEGTRLTVDGNLWKGRLVTVSGVSFIVASVMQFLPAAPAQVIK